MLKVLLCIPPDYGYDFPLLGTPALCGFLKSKGVNASQIDLNLKYRDFLFEKIKSLAKNPGLNKSAVLKLVLKKFFYENLKGRYYSKFLPRYSDKVFPSLPYDNNTNSSFYFSERMLSSRFLGRYLEDYQENTFYQFYWDKNILRQIYKEKPDIFGISITAPSQAIAAFTLGRLIKKHFPRIHVTVGGQWVSLYRKALLKDKDLFADFDSIIVFEGETPLYKLAQCIKEGRDIIVPNVILKNSQTDFSHTRSEEDLNQLPCPDFDGLPLNKYDSAEQAKITLTFETSRGCFWSRCAYCVDLPMPKPAYRVKSADLVVRDMKELKKKYNVDSLMFSDPALSCSQMQAISRLMIKEGLKINWWTMSRLQPAFNRKVFSLARKAGLIQVNFGFESASDKVCGIIDKGNIASISERIARDCHNAGIKVGLQVILGLPKETFQDGLDTVNFLIRNKKYITFPIFNTSYLTPESLIFRNPKKYGIEYKPNLGMPFRFFTPFKNPKGLGTKQAALLQELFYSLSKDKKADIQDENIPIPQLLFLSKGLSLKKVEFRLNKAVTKIGYLYNKKTKELFFLKDSEELIVKEIIKGRCLKSIYKDLKKRFPGEKSRASFDKFINLCLKNSSLTVRNGKK